MPSRIQTKGIGSRPSWFKQANSYSQTSLCLRDNLACKLTPVFSAWSPSDAPWFWWSNFGCIATTLPAFVSGEMAGWVHRDSKRVKPMEKKSLYKKPQYLKSSRLSNFDPSDLKIQKSITGDTCFKALEAFGFRQKKRHKHYILIPSITAKSPIMSLGYTRIFKKQGALNKKRHWQNTRISLKALWIVFQHLQPSYRMYRPSCITGMLNFNSSAFQTSGCSGGGQIFRNHFIDFS